MALAIPQRVSGSFQYRPPARQVTPARKPAPVSLSLSQAANRQVQQQIAPQEQAQTSFNNRQSAVIQSFANALLGKLQPIAGQVGNDYDQAINQTGALANQSAQFLKDQNPSGSVAALLQDAGAPQAQQDQITGQLGQTFGGGAGVLSFLGGAVPGGQMASDKAAAQSQAAQLPGLAALKGQQDLSSALWQQGQDRNTLEATRPALYQAATQNITSNNLARGKMAQSASQYATTRADKQTQYAQTRADKQAATDFLNWYKTQGVKATDAKINQKAAEFGVTSAQKNTALGIAQQVANTGQQNANTASRKAAAAAKKAKTAADYPNLTKAQVLHLRSGISAAFHGVPEQKDVNGKVIRAKLPSVDYQTAISHAISAGYSRAGATKMANRFYMPGDRGRPKK